MVKKHLQTYFAAMNLLSANSVAAELTMGVPKLVDVLDDVHKTRIAAFRRLAAYFQRNPMPLESGSNEWRYNCFAN